MKLLTLTIFLMLFVTACPKKQDSSFRHKERTPLGVSVLSNSTITPAHKTAIDDGLTTMFRIADNEPYSYSNAWNWATQSYGFSRHGSYTVRLEPKSSRCETPAFLIERKVAVGTNYDGSIYDKDPRPGYVAICAAGAMELENMKPGMTVVDDLSILSTVVKYEAEHNLLFEVDRTKFNATQYHQTSGHPILPDPITGEFASVETEAVHVAGFCVLVVK